MVTVVDGPVAQNGICYNPRRRGDKLMAEVIKVVGYPGLRAGI